MGKKLYVGNLPYSATEDSLKEAFSRFGTVDSATVIMDRDTGRSKGFGFIEMSSDQEAAAAIGKLDGTEMDGRAIKVSEARPQADRERSGSRQSQGGGGRSGYRW